MTVRDQAEQISTLVDAKTRQQDEIDSLTSRISHLESHYVPKDKINVLESRCLELEQKFDYEKSLRVRFEVRENHWTVSVSILVVILCACSS